MNVLVTGACGLLGAHVTAALSREHRVVGLDRHPWWGSRPAEILQGDLLSESFVADAVARVAPSVVVHCAAMVDVDACERQPDLADAYNAGITGRLARAAGPACLFIYITTDGIFQGDQPYRREEDEPKPLTAYGWSKLRGEHEVQAAGHNHLIVRTNFYGWSSGRKKTSAEWLFRALAGGERIVGFADFFFSPIYVVDFVDRLERLIRRPERGIVNLCGSERISKYDFAIALAAEAQLSASSIAKGSIDDADLAAPRPKDMSLSTARVSGILGEAMPDCRAGIRRFLSHRDATLERRFAAAVGAPAGEGRS
jgi:dTDP-4-dehydrorhamnose reductase